MSSEPNELEELLWQVIQEAPDCNCTFDGYDIIERHMACVAAALRANPAAVLQALGYPSKRGCADRWVCCIHLLTDEERRNA